MLSSHDTTLVQYACRRWGKVNHFWACWSQFEGVRMSLQIHQLCVCCVMCLYTVDGTTAQPAVNVEPPKQCPMLDLSPLLANHLKVDSIVRDTNGAVMTLSCSHGSYFAEGGKTRTLVCQDGKWPSVIPKCTGSSHRLGSSLWTNRLTCFALLFRW